MKFLADNDFHPLSYMDQLYDYLPRQTGAGSARRLTFDDGYPDTYRIVMPILKENMALPGRSSVPTYDTDQDASIQQVKEMQALRPYHCLAQLSS